MPDRICLYCGSFNPPGLHHQAVAEELTRHFESVRIIPCGPRPDKPSSNAVPPVFRATLVDLAFHKMPRVTVDLFDLEQPLFTRNDDLEERYSGLGEVWHAVPAVSVAGGGTGQSIIQKYWRNGAELWQRLRFAVFYHPEAPPAKADLPPRHHLLEVARNGSSHQLRRWLYDEQSCEGHIDHTVLNYIHRYGLYKLGHPLTEAEVPLHRSKLLVATADFNPKAEEWRERLAGLLTTDDPEGILVIGGDGTMLRAIRKWWRLRVPYIGLNAGHLGFLMNESSELITKGGTLSEKLTVRRLPMLRVRFQKRDGSWVEHLSFNDGWIERHGAQPAWLRVSLNGEVKLEKLVCDGALVATAAGSTAYARSMGGPPLLADTPAWLLVGSNVMRPVGWKSALLPMDATIRIESIDTVRRPLTGCAAGETVEDVVCMEAQISRVASVELAFSPKHDMAKKISDLHFGSVGAI